MLQPLDTPRTANAQAATDTAADRLAQSNSLADLAARIKVEHTAVSTALNESVKHAIAAGELLIEAKDQIAHGQWLPWLDDHCTISERTAQLYMRCAKNRRAIEDQIRNGVADLSLNEAAAMLMLSSEVRKLFAFAKRLESADPEHLIDICAAGGFAVIRTNPFGSKEWNELTEPEQLEWTLWVLFGVKVVGVSAEEAAYYANRKQSRGWTLTEWYGNEGDEYRARCLGKVMPQSAKDDWRAFFESNSNKTLNEIKAEIDTLEAARVERLAPCETAKAKRASRRRVAT